MGADESGKILTSRVKFMLKVHSGIVLIEIGVLYEMETGINPLFPSIIEILG